MLLAILGWCLFGLIAGAIARLLIPGRQPIGIMMTIVLGIVGSLTGGFVGYLLVGGEPLQASGWILSILGAVIVLGLYVAFSRPRREVKHMR
ncbi:MAG: GlsB/YeaQ/YmgE family stress response membrane protein [Planctomycetes bacterium]|nr:GlsB/YeaQ/YmgE family stress response membrane protein [Planctomycetota bacterium]